MHIILHEENIEINQSNNSQIPPPSLETFEVS